MPDTATAPLPPDQGLYPTLTSGKTGPLYSASVAPLDSVDALPQIKQTHWRTKDTEEPQTASLEPGEHAPKITLGINNPGNIKTIGPNGRLMYASYNNPQEGVTAIGDWGVRAQQNHGLVTLRQLIDHPRHGYAPQSDPGNKGKPLVQDAADRMGVDPDQPIDLSDPYMRQKWTDAILAQEGAGAHASAGSLPGYQDYLGKQNQLLEEKQNSLNNLLKSLGDFKGSSQERRKMLQDALDRSRSLQDQMTTLARNPPTQKPTDFMNTFGTLAMLIGAIGGLKSRQPATAALQAAAGVIEGVQTNNEQEYARNFKTWQVQSKLLADLTGIQANDFRAIMENDRIDELERHNLLEEKLHEYGMQDSLDKLRMGMYEEAWKAPYESMKLHEDLELTRARIEEAHAHAARERALAEGGGKVTQFIDAGNIDESGNPIPYSVDQQGNTFRTQMQTDESGNTQQIRVPYNPVSPSRIPATGTANTEMQLFHNLEDARESGDQERIKTATQAIKDFNQARGKGVGQARYATGMFMQKLMEEKPELTSSEISEALGEFKRIQSLEGAFAGGQLGKQLVSLNTVADHILLVQEYFENLHNGNIPRANELANFVAREKGLPEVTNFNAGRNIMTGEVVRLLTATGGTENDRKEMAATFPNFLSPAQGEGVVKVFSRFVGGRFEALEQQYAQNDPKRKDRFHNALLTDKSRKVFANSQESVGGASPISSSNVGQLRDMLLNARDKKEGEAGYLTPEQRTQIVDRLGKLGR